MKSKTLTLILSTIFAFTFLAGGPAFAQTAVLGIGSDASQVNHYPGPDGQIGTGDDVVSAGNTTVSNSAPNTNGSYGYNAFKFSPMGPDDAALPTGFDAVTFVDGSITIDKGVFASGGGTIVTGLNVTSGTEPFPGHGAYTAAISAVNSGTYDSGSHAFTLNADFSYTITGVGQGVEPGVAFSGTAIYQAAGDFGTNTGDAYFENVVKPLATAQGATGAVYFSATGMLTVLGYPVRISVVALESAGVTINAGMNDAWVSEGAPFQGLFFTVYEDFGLLFLSWFTFDSQVPGQNTATFGASDQRWVTGIGSYVGNSVTVSAELTSGGIFNGAVPLAGQTPNYGTITIVFNSCNEAILTYNFPGPGLSGQMVLTRVVTDNVALCEALAAQ